MKIPKWSCRVKCKATLLTSLRVFENTEDTQYKTIQIQLLLLLLFAILLLLLVILLLVLSELKMGIQTPTVFCFSL